MTNETSEFIETCRTRARAIKGRHEELGSSVTLAQAYELLAASEGYRTWAAMRAAGEARPKPAQMEIHEDDHGWLFSVIMYRRVSLDAYDAREDFDVPALLKAAHADLSYVFMDGEDYPAMRFRDTMRTGPDEYSVIVDIEGSPLKDIEWHRGRMDLAENVTRFSYGSYPEHGSRCDAVFHGSANVPEGERRWSDISARPIVSR